MIRAGKDQTKQLIISAEACSFKSVIITYYTEIVSYFKLKQCWHTQGIVTFPPGCVLAALPPPFIFVDVAAESKFHLTTHHISVNSD